MRLRKPAPATVALSPDYSAGLARSFALQKDSSGQSRLRTLHDNGEALAWRLHIIEQAEHTIDAQYYSWHLDTSGLALIEKLIDAADRGVRVRVLLDDIHIFGMDRQIATLNRHRNVEVRLFNPFTYRSRFKLVRILELLFKLSRLNHRMHNKLLVVDNLVAIVGGRNIGDEYLNLHASLMFRDLDLMLAGTCVEQLSASFDIYWNHRLSFTARKLIALRPRALDFKHLRKQIEKRLRPHLDEIEEFQLYTTKLVAANMPAELLPIVAKVDVLYDAPGFDNHTSKQSLDILNKCSLQAQEQVIIVSAYFIPDEGLLDTMQHLIKKGVRIKVYTNSLASIDVTVAFSGYQNYRQRLLAMGVELFEHRATQDADTHSGMQYTLHSKCIVYDSAWVYVGTLNLDPRSASLNTEIGLLINSADLAHDIRNSIEQQENQGEYWHVTHNNKSQLRWHYAATWLDRQPNRGRWQVFSNWLFSLLPIKRHL